MGRRKKEDTVEVAIIERPITKTSIIDELKKNSIKS